MAWSPDVLAVKLHPQFDTKTKTKTVLLEATKFAKAMINAYCGIVL